MVTANPALFFNLGSMGFATGSQEKRARKPSLKARVQQMKFIQEGMLRPLITAGTKRQLIKLLDLIRDDLLKAATQEMQFRIEVDEKEVSELLAGKADRIRTAEITIPVHIEGELGHETVANLRAALESLDSLMDWMVECTSSDRGDTALKLAQMQSLENSAGHAPFDAISLLRALSLVFDGSVTDWNAKSLKAIIALFDDLMTETEDAFLNTKTSWPTDTVSEDEFRSSVGI